MYDHTSNLTLLQFLTQLYAICIKSILNNFIQSYSSLDYFILVFKTKSLYFRSNNFTRLKIDNPYTKRPLVLNLLLLCVTYKLFIILAIYRFVCIHNVQHNHKQHQHKTKYILSLVCVYITK